MNPHNNSIFHVGWSQDNQHLITGSADFTGGVWDVERETGCILAKHTGSVKCIKNSPIGNTIYATASRDGKIFLWDLRTHGASNGLNSTYEPIGEINRASEIKAKTRKDPVSFTGLEFLEWGNIIASVQADEAEIRFWDIRKSESAKGKKNQKALLGKVDPLTWMQENRLKDMKKDRANDRMNNIRLQSSLLKSGPGNSWISSIGGAILVSSMSNSLYLYKDILKLDTQPPIKFIGHKSSFYVKSCISPDMTHVASGSSDGCLYVWDIEKNEMPHVLQTGNVSELSCVDWTYGNSFFIATSSDSAVVNFWGFDDMSS